MTRVPRVMLVVEAADVAERGGVITAALAAGVDAVQLRDRRASARALLAAAQALRAPTRRHGAALLVNDRIDVALAAAADGVHLPAASWPLATARRLLGPDAWIGCSTHAAPEAEAALAEGADYVVLGPIFTTPSKTAFGPPIGLAALAAVRARERLVAIGGITPANASEVRRAGAHGIAIIRAVLDSSDSAAAARALRAAMDER